MVRGPTPINILLVEDDPGDVELTRRALQRAKLQNRVWIVGDGVEGLAADGFLTKPVDFARLEAVIRRIAGLGWAIVKTARAQR